MTGAGAFDADNAGQVTAMENMVTAGAKGILITPGDTKAIVPAIQKARDAGVLVIALDTPTEPMDATDALFATDNFKAGLSDWPICQGGHGRRQSRSSPRSTARPASRSASCATMGSSLASAAVDEAAATPTADMSTFAEDPRVVCSQDADGDEAKSQTAMENCLQANPDITLVYTINEPAARGAYTALQAAGREKDVLIVSVDGGCTGVERRQGGKIAATSQQYPLKMAQMGVDAVVNFVKTGEKPSGYTDTGVTLITDKPQEGVDSEDTTFGSRTAGVVASKRTGVQARHRAGPGLHVPPRTT